MYEEPPIKCLISQLTLEKSKSNVLLKTYLSLPNKKQA